MDELIYASATVLAEAIRTKQVSSEEVVKAYLQRIEAVNPRLNAVVQLSSTVRAEARAADEALARGTPAGALHGVPFTVKDWIETRGIVCVAGFEDRREHIPKADASAVARLRAAGAILLGKTKPGSGADIYPAPRNPYDLARMPGGSSSGEAAIIAAGGSPLGLGSDSGGSIRWPAHCCGIAGLKPTNGLVPNTGHVPCICALADPRTTIGPMARTVDDLGLILSLITGVDGQDAGVVPVPLDDALAVDIESLRVAYFTAFEGASASVEVAETVATVIRTLKSYGIETRPACPPRIEESLPITRAYWARPESISLHRWRPWHPSTLNADEVERSIFEWDRLRRSFLRFMQEFDLIVCPAAPYPAPVRTESLDDDYIYTLPYSLTGYPCVVVRAGTSSDNLPIGVQLIARPWHDHVALAGARIVESELGGWQRPPL